MIVYSKIDTDQFFFFFVFIILNKSGAKTKRLPGGLGSNGSRQGVGGENILRPPKNRAVFYYRLDLIIQLVLL